MLIGLAGRKGSGKDVAGSILVDGYDFVKYAFAAPLKAALAAMFNVPYHLFDTPALKETPLPELLHYTPRFLMQTLGTEWGRDIVSDSLWARLAANFLDSVDADVVVTDVRFNSEAEVIKQRGGVIWYLTRDQTPYSAHDAHRSEGGPDADYVDAYIDNNGSVAALHQRIKELVDHDDLRPGQHSFITQLLAQ